MTKSSTDEQSLAAEFNSTQVALIREAEAGGQIEGKLSDIDFYVINDPRARTYGAIVEDEEIGRIRYEIDPGGRVVLLSTVVPPEYRGQGVASELIRRVLVELREQGRQVVVDCPIIATFLDRHPGFNVIVATGE